MNSKPTALVRAFQLALSGRYVSVDGIKKALNEEGYSQDQIIGPSVIEQLEGLIRSAQGS